MTESAGPDTRPFTGTERFSLIRKLGSGGMGVVFEAEDKVRSSRVALKTLHRLNPTDLYRFKKEFRSLQTFVHPNLVTLYEFISEQGQWFFTMEFVEGEDFLAYVRGPHGDDGAGSESFQGPRKSRRQSDRVVSTLQGYSSTQRPEDWELGPGPPVTAYEEDDLPGPEFIPHFPLPDTIEASTAGTTVIDEDRVQATEGDPPFDLAGAPGSVGIPAPATLIGQTTPESPYAVANTGPACDVPRLRSVLEQIAGGLNYLHESGMLHRDLKPSNVLVTPAGRVAILDFGLITEVARSVRADGLLMEEASREFPRVTGPAQDLAQTDQGLVVGTIRYMAPEQADCLPLTRAADWYSFGIMMYEALVGELPFLGTGSAILASKRRGQVTTPVARRHGIPGELSSLCVKLLQSDPKDRPSYAEIMAVLRQGSAACSQPAAADRISSDHPFVGRAHELSRLRAAFASVREGGSVVVLVHGRSGSGKSCLIERFLDQGLGQQGEVILRGRCFEQESVPFKAVDSLIDSLSRHLMARPVHPLQQLLPRDIGTLSRMFPVLKRVESIAAAAELQVLPPDPLELRRRAFGALRELLTQLGGIVPLVLWIDDLQWGDLDSAELLSEVLRGPQPPRLLLLASCRSEDERANPCLRALSGADSLIEGGAHVVRIDVGPLAPGDAERLAAILLNESGACVSEQTASIARESSGNPYLITEIARHVQACSADLEAGARIDQGINVQQMLWTRIERLPGELTSLLEVVAVAGQPLSQKCAYSASRLDIKDQAALVQLRNERLLRSNGPGIDDEIDVYHDQIRETLLDRLTDETRRGHHRRLAADLEADGRTDPETLAVHFAGGGQPARAGDYYRAAAFKASQAMAFDRAASLCRRALELGNWPFPTEGRLKAELGDALANSRRGREAGHVYLDAAAGVPPAESIELRRRAFQQLLTSGDHDLGIDVLRRVFQDVGLRYPETPGKALLSAALGLALLRVRGLGFRPRSEEAIDQDELLRLDVGWSGGLSLCLIDSARAAEIFIHNLNRALRAGEPLRTTRALLAVSSLFAVRGSRGVRRYAESLRHAEHGMAHLDDPNILALYYMVRGLAAYSMGQWSRSLELNDQSATLFRERCTGMTMSLEMAAYYSLRSLCWLGDVAELRRRRRALLSEAQERQDLFAVTNYCTEVMTYDLLADDDPAGAAHEIEDAMSRWSHRGFHAQHLFALIANLRVDLYRGHGAVARRRIHDAWDAYRRSQLHRSSIGRIIINHHIANSALASWSDHASKATLCREASAAADRLDHERIDYAAALARIIRARLATFAGDQATAVRLYQSAADQFRALQMPFYESAALFRLGELLKTDTGQGLVQTANQCLESRLIRNPGAMIRMLLP